MDTAAMTNRIDVNQDIVGYDMPHYLHLLTGHYMVQEPRYYARRPRGTNDWLLTATLSGRGRFGTGPGQLVAEPRDLVMIPPRTKHDYGALPGENEWELIWAHFHPRAHWHDWLAWPEHTPGLMRMPIVDDRDWREVKACFRRVHNYATGVGRRYGQDLAMNALERLLLCCQSILASEQPRLDERILTVLQFINTELAQEMDIASMAESVSLSPSRFAHVFRQQVGVSPMHYLDLQRLQRATQLLERTTKSVSQIAFEVGFDPVHFSLRFKQHTGLSPRAYRAQKMSA